MHAFLYISLPAICLLCVFAVGELVVRNIRGRNVWLALIFFAFALVLLRAFLLFSGWMSAVPVLYESTIAVNFWIGPLIYFYLRDALGLTRVGDRPLRVNLRRMAPHFVPGLVVFLLVLPNTLQPADVIRERIAVGMQHFADAPNVMREDPYMLLTPLALVHVAVYLGLLVVAMLSLLNLESLRRQETVRAFLILTALALISTASGFTGIAAGLRAPVEFAIGLLALVAPLTYLFQKRYPDLFEVLEGLLRTEREKRARYLQSRLAGVDLEQLERRLSELMDGERVYRREDLSLPALAALLQTTPHRLSEYLNNHQQISFSEFVNRRRVEASRELLRTRPDQTVLSIAYDVGFNSKSAFNKAFVRYTGVSPTEFRKQTAGP